VKLIILLRKQFTIENLDYYLNELAKDYVKITRRRGTPIEIIIVGGASILINYGFRNNTNDVDALLNWGFLDQSIKNVSVKFDLERNWLNSDFIHTKSFSPKIVEFSTFYKCFHGKLFVRTIKSEYLIAMKMIAGRIYKNDLSDIVGILLAEKENGYLVTWEIIEKAIFKLYGSLEVVSADIIRIVKRMLIEQNLNKIYMFYIESEKLAKDQILNLRVINENILLEDDFINFTELFIQSLHYEAD
jgi:hypothetical protein